MRQGAERRVEGGMAAFPLSPQPVQLNTRTLPLKGTSFVHVNINNACNVNVN